MDSICGMERLIEVGDDVVNVLDSDAQPDRLGPHAGLFLLFGRHLPVRGRCGVAGARSGAAPERSVKTSPGYDFSGSFIIGKRRRCSAQGKLPLSTMIPPSVVPCPPMNFVSDSSTMSAPYSIGRSRIGVGTVLSTI